jgi:hypothetical protein
MDPADTFEFVQENISSNKMHLIFFNIVLNAAALLHSTVDCVSALDVLIGLLDNNEVNLTSDSDSHTTSVLVAQDSTSGDRPAVNIIGQFAICKTELIMMDTTYINGIPQGIFYSNIPILSVKWWPKYIFFQLDV